MRILLTNNTLSHRAGSELYVRDLAIALMARGHFPVVYSTVIGDMAEDLRRATIPVIDDLRVLSTPPDIIHGQHHIETMTAALQFPQTPAIYACHGWLPWEETPPIFPSIFRYVAVSTVCRERILTTGAIPEENVSIIYNFVDLDKFKLRDRLPPQPRSALVFSNYIGESPTLTAIRTACTRFGIERVDLVGACSGNVVTNPEEILGNYDVVFAVGRSALEAMASGCAVVVIDVAGLGGMVSTENVATMRSLNFGLRATQAGPTTEETVFRTLRCYDAVDARLVCEWIREDADLSKAVARWLDVYRQVISDRQALGGNAAIAFAHGQLSAASQYLRSLSPVIKTRHEAENRAYQAACAQAGLAARVTGLESNLSAANGSLAELAGRLSRQEAAFAASLTQARETQADLAARLSQREAELNAILGCRTWKAMSRYRALRAWLGRRCSQRSPMSAGSLS